MIASVAGLTDVGESREHNEDGFVILDLRSGDPLPDASDGITLEEAPVILGVSDGMGGASAGEIASALTLDVLQEEASSNGTQLEAGATQAAESWLANVIQKANLRVREEGRKDESVRGMGATVTIAAVFPAQVVLGHVGDSRAYLLREGKLEQLTTDHTFVGQMVARGHLTPEEARTHDHRHLLLQAVGAKDVLSVDTLSHELKAGDHLLLCSDGLYDLVDDDAIAEILASPEDPQTQCSALVKAALAGGGFDNITVIVLRVG